MAVERAALDTSKIRFRKQFDRRKAFKWQGPFENWSRAWVKKNFWRVRTLHGSEADSLQECAVVFADCLRRYADRVDNPAWMMSLYKVSIVNEWHTFAQRDSRLRLTRDDEQLSAVYGMAQQADVNYGPLTLTWESASAELRHVISIIAEAPAELLGMLFSSDDAPSINRRLGQACGFSGEADFVGEMRALLS